MIERTIPTSTHGRYLVEPPRSSGVPPLFVGFHGYAEPAEMQLERMSSIPGVEGWLIVAIQGLHRFYRGRTRDVVASWMTRQDRTLAISDNRAFVAAVVDEVAREWGRGPLIFAGFSQGVAMAFRAACASSRPVSGVVALGGDIPPELDSTVLCRVRHVLLGRGLRDELYSSNLHGSDERRLAAAGVAVRSVALDASHEWTPEFSEAAGRFLAEHAR